MKDQCGRLSPELCGVEDASAYCTRAEIPAADDEEWPVSDSGDVKEGVGDDKGATVGVRAEHDTDRNRVLGHVPHPREEVVPPQIRHSLDPNSTLEGCQIGLGNIQEPVILSARTCDKPDSARRREQPQCGLDRPPVLIGARDDWIAVFLRDPDLFAVNSDVNQSCARPNRLSIARCEDARRNADRYNGGETTASITRLQPLGEFAIVCLAG
jgi:hypothetical protein